MFNLILPQEKAARSCEGRDAQPSLLNKMATNTAVNPLVVCLPCAPCPNFAQLSVERRHSREIHVSLTPEAPSDSRVSGLRERFHLVSWEPEPVGDFICIRDVF